MYLTYVYFLDYDIDGILKLNINDNTGKNPTLINDTFIKVPEKFIEEYMNDIEYDYIGEKLYNIETYNSSWKYFYENYYISFKTLKLIRQVGYINYPDDIAIGKVLYDAQILYNLKINYESNITEYISNINKIKDITPNKIYNLAILSVNFISKCTELIRSYKKYATMRLECGMGNVLFQVALLYGYCEMTDKIPVFCDNLFPYTKHCNNDLLKCQILKEFPYIKYVSTFSELSSTEDLMYDYNPPGNKKEYKNIEIKNYRYNMILEGRFMTDKCFPVLEKFIPSVNENITLSYPDDLSERYFIHLRLGDYLYNSGFNVNLEKYYNRCIKLILESLQSSETSKKIKLFVCYNSKLEEAQKIMETYNFKDKYDINDIVYQSENDTPYNTLYVMSQCIGGICANSTLSWFGGYLINCKHNLQYNKNNNHLFLPNKWVNNTEDDYTKDIYPTWAKVIDV